MDSGILTDILGAIVNGASTGFDGIKGNAEALFYKLLILEVVLFGIGVALNKIDVQRELVAKVLAIGFVQFLLFRYVWLVDGLRDGFVSMGLVAAGNNLSISDFLDPSAFVKLGFDKVFAVIDGRFAEHGVWSLISAPGLVWVFQGAILLLMFFAFAAVGLQIFLAVAEFYLVSSLAIILIPFLVVQRTGFLGLRALNGLIAICIKLMVIAFIASLALPVIELLSFTNDQPTIKESMSLTIGALAIALLMWRAPSIAMSLISGSGGIDVSSSVVSPVLKGASMAGGAGNMMGSAARAGKGALGKVANATAQGLKDVKPS